MNRGLTIVELMIAMSISIAVALGAMFYFQSSQEQTRALKAEAQALQFGQVIASTFQQWFLTKPSSGFAVCKDVTDGKNAYCLDACATGEGQCKVAGVSSAVGANARVAFFSTSCEDVGGTYGGLTFPEFCGVSCSAGRRPVTSLRVVGPGVDKLKKFPASATQNEYAAAALCFSRDATAGTLQMRVAAFRLSLNKQVVLQEQTFVFPEATFDSPGVYFVNE